MKTIIKKIKVIKLLNIKINALQVMVEEIHYYKVINVTAKCLSVFFAVFYFFTSCSDSTGRGDWFTLCGFSFRYGPLVSTSTITVRHSKSTDLFKN